MVHDAVIVRTYALIRSSVPNVCESDCAAEVTTQ